MLFQRHILTEQQRIMVKAGDIVGVHAADTYANRALYRECESKSRTTGVTDSMLHRVYYVANKPDSNFPSAGTVITTNTNTDGLTVSLKPSVIWMKRKPLSDLIYNIYNHGCVIIGS